MEEVVGHKGKRVVLMALPFQGHLNPLLQLATLLHSQAFSITIVHTLHNPPNPSNHPDFVFLPIPDSEAPDTLDFAALVLSLNINCEAPFRELLGKMIMEQQEDQQLDEIACIIYDGFMYFVDSVANHFKLPGIIFHTTSAVNMLCHSKYPKLQEQGHVPLPDTMLQDLIPGLHPLVYKDLPITTMRNVKSYLQLIYNVWSVRSASAMIWNTVDCLEQSVLAQLQQHHQVPVFSVGPLQNIAKASFSSLIKEDNSCIEWLDKQTKNSVLYVSIGSVATITEKELIEMARGLANSKHPFLWVIRPGSVAGSEWIELLPNDFKEATEERGYIVKWAPQRKVLAHFAVGGFWSHCGWNSTLETLSEGVPVICKPCLGDQRINARYLSQVWKVGLQLGNGFARGEIERAVRLLMGGKEGVDMRKRSMDLKEQIEISIREGGSSYNSLSKLVKFIM